MDQFTFSLPFNHSDEEFLRELKMRGISENTPFFVKKKSLDARQRNITWVYTVTKTNPFIYPEPTPLKTLPEKKPIIVGTGPAGLFACYRFLQYGIRPILIEQGDPVSERMRKIAHFIKTGDLDENSNVCFGAGGAGTFSDGKLMTRVKNPFLPFIMDTLIRFGAQEEIRYLSHPHLGSQKIREIVRKMLIFFESNGVVVRFNTKMTALQIEEKKNDRNVTGVQTSQGNIVAGPVFLATGHSARDVYSFLHQQRIHLEFKPFAVGFRIEHPAFYIDGMQYKKFASHPALSHAEYFLTYTDKKEGRGVYSFCMCPGGIILNASTERGGVVCNGMSHARRSGVYSNSAIVAGVNETDLNGDNVFKGLYFQKQLEMDFGKAVNYSGNSHALPAMRVTDFLKNKPSSSLPRSSCPHPLANYPVYEVFPDFLIKAFQKGLKAFDQKMKGYIYSDAILIAPETRTSAPIRIVRDRETFNSVSIAGLYPVGEGAGYSGGITSSALDGIRAVDAYIGTLTR